MLGNARLPHRAGHPGVRRGAGWLAQIGLFVMLGLLATPSELPAQRLPAVVAALALLLLARPLSVLVCADAFRMPWRRQTFLSWAGLRGAVPIVLATIPAGPAARTPAAVQRRVHRRGRLHPGAGSDAAGVARRWACSRPTPRNLDVEAAPLEGLDADLLQS